MSILIRGVSMPKMPEKMEQGQEVPYVDVRVFADGDAVISTGVRPYYKKYQAIELPPHGRLIDADALKNKHHWTDDFYETEYVEVEDIDAAPTIIPAEGGDAT